VKARSDAPVNVRQVPLEEDNSIHSHAVKPPTLIRVNTFTSGFQGIVDGYGIPRYEEVNPGFFAIAMFPFLFGVMFGDICHGAMMVAFALYLISNETATLKSYKHQNEIFLMVFDGRWTVLMCGVCATYMGLIYNEGLSVAFDWFGSGYKLDHFPESSFGAKSGAPVNCLSGASMGHGLYGPMGNASCLIGSMVVSSYSFANHTHKFLPTQLFKGKDYSSNTNGATFPSLWCKKSTKGASTMNVISGNTGNSYGNDACDGGVLNMPSSADPLSQPPCTPTDLPGTNCYNYTGKWFNSPETATKEDLITNYDDLVRVNKWSQSLQEFMPYTFGVDPIWRHSDQLISFTNSLKMKMSVIIGVSQMTFGIILKILNFIHAGHWSLVLAVGVPEFLFMMCTFGYMNFLIFLKWSTPYAVSLGGAGPKCFDTCLCPWTGYGSDLNKAMNYAKMALPSSVSRTPPGIVNSMLSMFGIPSFKPGSAGACDQWLFAEQESIQTVFILIAVVAMPWLLLTEPCLVKCEHDEKMKQKETRPAASSEEHDAAHEEEDDFEFADIFVHQAIHTIEFVLGCVSNTASYLRLWALSLAHSQLSEVFWEYIMMGFHMGFSGQNPGLAGGSLMTILCFFIFFLCTMAVLMMMESLSAFLHALRLQWVEFQGKFYSADGHKFSPLSFDDTFAADEE